MWGLLSPEKSFLMGQVHIFGAAAQLPADLLRIWRPPAPQVGGGGGPEYTGDSLIWPGLPPDNQGSVRNPETPATLQ